MVYFREINPELIVISANREEDLFGQMSPVNLGNRSFGCTALINDVQVSSVGHFA